MFPKLLSYLFPINIFKQDSKINKSIEVTWNNGELVLDTENTNYSYGSLQRILKKGLQRIGYKNIKNYKNILVLGVAGGSVIKTLVNEIQFEGKITGIEIDKEIIEIANKYFNLNNVKNLEIIIDDAASFVSKTQKKYDLVIIDIFQDKFMPEFLFELKFTNQLKTILNKNGFIIFNTMILNDNDKQRNLDYSSLFKENEFVINKISKLEKYNELLIINKL